MNQVILSRAKLNQSVTPLLDKRIQNGFVYVQTKHKFDEHCINEKGECVEHKENVIQN